MGFPVLRQRLSASQNWLESSIYFGLQTAAKASGLVSPTGKNSQVFFRRLMKYDFCRKVGIGIVLSLVLLLAAFAQAQVLTGTISGTVTDQTSAVIPGAKVTAVDASTGHALTTTTGTGGEYVIASVPFGFYNVTVEAAG